MKIFRYSLFMSWLKKCRSYPWQPISIITHNIISWRSHSIRRFCSGIKSSFKYPEKENLIYVYCQSDKYHQIKITTWMLKIYILFQWFCYILKKQTTFCLQDWEAETLRSSKLHYNMLAIVSSLQRHYTILYYCPIFCR